MDIQSTPKRNNSTGFRNPSLTTPRRSSKTIHPSIFSRTFYRCNGAGGEWNINHSPSSTTTSTSSSSSTTSTPPSSPSRLFFSSMAVIHQDISHNFSSVSEEVDCMENSLVLRSYNELGDELGDEGGLEVILNYDQSVSYRET